MKTIGKKRTGLWITLGIVVILVFWFVGSYNSLVTLSESVDTAWAQVENQYQRRADLIPNLVNTVKGFAAQEKDIFLQVTQMRSAWAGAATRSEQIAAAKGMDSAISRLLVVAENYPNLKSNENFLALQSQLEGTENRITVERMRYNEAVRTYNIKIKRIPTVIIARLFGYDAESYFEIEEGTEQVPQVTFE